MKKFSLSIFLGAGIGFALLNLLYNIWQHSLKFQVALIILSSLVTSIVIYCLFHWSFPKINTQYSKKQILFLSIGSLLISLITFWAIHFSIFLPPGISGEHVLEINISDGNQGLQTKNYFAIIEIRINNEKIDLGRIEQIEGVWNRDEMSLATSQPGRLRFVFEGDQTTSIEILQSRSFYDSKLLIGIDGKFHEYDVLPGNNINWGQSLIKVQTPPLNLLNQFLYFGSCVFFIAGVFFMTFAFGVILFSAKKGFIIFLLIGAILQIFALGGGIINLILRYTLIPRSSSEVHILISTIGFVLFMIGSIKISYLSQIPKPINLKQLMITYWKQIFENDALMDILIILIPIAIFTLISNQGWLFDSSKAPDAWVYKAHFYYPGYAEHISYLDQNYKISRLSFIIPGYLIYRIFGPLAGYYIFALGILIASLVCFYFLVRMLFNRQTSLVSTLTLSCFTYLHGNIGWSYHNGAFSLYYILTIFILLAATKLQLARSYLLTFLGGCSMAATLVINPSAAVFLPCLGTFFILLGKEPFRKQAWQSLLWFMGGIFSVIIALGSIHFLSGGPSIEFILPHMNKFTSMTISSVIHFQFTTYLIVLLIISIGVLLFSIFARGGAENKYKRIIISSQILYISSLIFFLFLGYIIGQNIFGLSFVSYVLIIPAMISLSGVFAMIFEKDNIFSRLWVGLISCLIFIVPLLLAQSLKVNDFFVKLPHSAMVMLIFGVAGILLALIIKKIKTSLLLIVTVLSVLNLYAGIDLSVYSLFGPDCSISKDLYQTYLDTTQFLKNYPDLPEKGKYWYDLEENAKVQPESELCPSIALANVFFPISRGILAQSIDDSPLDEKRIDIENWSDKMIEKVGRTGYLVGFSSPENWNAYYKIIESRMKKSGYDLFEKDYSVIREGKITIRISIMELQ